MGTAGRASCQEAGPGSAPQSCTARACHAAAFASLAAALRLRPPRLQCRCAGGAGRTSGSNVCAGSSPGATAPPSWGSRAMGFRLSRLVRNTVKLRACGGGRQQGRVEDRERAWRTGSERAVGCWPRGLAWRRAACCRCSSTWTEPASALLALPTHPARLRPAPRPSPRPPTPPGPLAPPATCAAVAPDSSPPPRLATRPARPPAHLRRHAQRVLQQQRGQGHKGGELAKGDLRGAGGQGRAG